MGIYEEYKELIKYEILQTLYPELSGMWQYDFVNFVEIVSLREGKKI